MKYIAVAKFFVLALIAWLLVACGGGDESALSPVSTHKNATATLVAPQSGWWWNPAESGSGYSLELQGNQIFMTAYLYETNGLATWYASGLIRQSSGAYSGAVQRYSGGQTLLGTYKAPTSTTVANALLSFNTASIGNLTITFADGSPSRTVALQRFAISSPTAFATSNGSFDNGWWWNEAESGRGYFIEVQGSAVFIGSYMYDITGQPAWYVSYVPALQGSQTMSSGLDRYTSGQSLGGSYKAPTKAAASAGTMAFNFTSRTTANMILPNGKSVALKRFIFNTTTSETPPPSIKATTFDVASVKAAIPDISAIVPICSNSSQQSAMQGTSAIVKRALLSRAMEISQVQRAAFPVPSKKASGPPTKPVDTLGDCGGRLTYPQYSHASGVTTATLAFENYCTTDSDGGRQFLNGSIDYVNTGTPTESGPITTKVTATSPVGLSIIQQDKTSKVLSSQVIAFTNFNYTVGVPGGKPTQAQPSSYGIDELTITDKLTNKTYRESGYKVVFFTTPSGGQQVTMSGRGYRSNGDYFDVSTTTPQVTDSSGNTVSGVIAFTGANGSTAVATFVPGTVSQATMTVNGTPVTGLSACK